MNLDAIQLAELREKRRHNLEAEEAERRKARAAEKTAIAKIGDTVTKGATGMAEILHGRNDGNWGMTGDPTLDQTYDQSYVALDLETKQIFNGHKRQASAIIIDFMPMLGSVKGDSVDSTFLALKRIYDIMREKNRGATNYTVANLAQYIMPCMSIAAQVSYHELLLKLAHNPKLSMRMSIRKIFDALGIDFDSFTANLADYELRLQKIKTTLAEFPMPLDLPVLKRWIWLTSFAFLDAPGRNAACFICRPTYYFDPVTAGPHSLCTTQQPIASNATPGANRTYAQIVTSLDYMESTLGNILMDVTLQAVAGDILNAFGDRLVPWSKLNVDPYEDPFYYDEEFLLELTNARIMKKPGDGIWPGVSIIYDKFGNIGQGYMSATGHFMSFFGSFRDTYVTSGAYGKDGQIIFTDGHESLTREQTNIAESWMHTYGSASDTQTIYYWDDTDPGNEFKSTTLSAGTGEKFLFLESYGTEILTRANVITVDSSGAIATSVTQDSNEAYDMTDMYSTNSLDHYVWRYYLDSGNHPLLVATDLDSYGQITNNSLQQSTRIKNRALWGYATLKLAKVGRPSDKGDHKGFKSKSQKDSKAPKDSKGSSPEVR